MNNGERIRRHAINRRTEKKKDKKNNGTAALTCPWAFLGHGLGPWHPP